MREEECLQNHAERQEDIELRAQVPQQVWGGVIPTQAPLRCFPYLEMEVILSIS